MNVLVTGGGGYIGSVLVRKLIKKGINATVLDSMIYGKSSLRDVRDNIELFIGDIRDEKLLKTILKNTDSVIHLASISNDPSSELDHKLTMDVNYNATINLVDLSKKLGVKRFIFASTSSVYGIKETDNVTEDLELEPLTVYSKTKADAEEYVLDNNSDDFTTTAVRSATVCGYSPRMRLDVVVNILTAHAINNHRIIVYGGSQKRPNIHIDDISDLYLMMLNADAKKISGEAFNVGFENYTVMDIAKNVRKIINPFIRIDTQPTDDLRSYHISSEKVMHTLGFFPKKTIDDAILDMKCAFSEGKIPNWTDSKYYNVKRLKELKNK